MHCREERFLRFCFQSVDRPDRLWRRFRDFIAAGDSAMNRFQTARQPSSTMLPWHHSPMSRASFVQQLAGGIGGIALAQMLAADHAAAAQTENLYGGLHHPAKVKRIIQLFLNGGASQMDTFDYKPELERLNGQMLGPKEKPEGFTAPAGAVMKSPFTFQQYGPFSKLTSRRCRMESTTSTTCPADSFASPCRGRT